MSIQQHIKGFLVLKRPLEFHHSIENPRIPNILEFLFVINLLVNSDKYKDFISSSKLIVHQILKNYCIRIFPEKDVEI